MHTRVWLLWLITGLVSVALAAGPLYLCLIASAAMLVFLSLRPDNPDQSQRAWFVRVGALVWLSYMLFSLITIGGMRGATIIVALPELRMPPWLGGLVLGGPISAEGLAWAAQRGLQIWTLLIVFGVFNALVDRYRVLRLAPPAFYQLGLVISIALAFAPGAVRAAIAIREAQRARGHRFAGMASWLALAAPLLAGSLERSTQLAEALDARGYGRGGTGGLSLWRRATALCGLLAVGGGLVGWFYYGPGFAGYAAAGSSIGGLVAAVPALLLGRRAQAQTRYRRERFQRRDWQISACLLLANLALLALWLLGAPLGYNPFPQISWPPFDWRVGLALLLLASPALFGGPLRPRQPRNRRRRRRDREVIT